MNTLTFDACENILIETVTGIYGQIIDTDNPIVKGPKLALDILRKSPRYKILDASAVWERIQKSNLDEEEETLLVTHLPFTAFSVLAPGGLLCFTQGDPFHNKNDVIWTLVGGVFGETLPDKSTGYLALPPMQRTLEGGRHLVLDTDSDYEEKIQRRLYDQTQKYLLLINFSGHNKEIVTVSEKLQKKRAKKGKYPNFEYYVLTLDKEATKALPATKRFTLLGRQSPRAHFRRGHKRIRRGNLEWVSECYVGLKNRRTLGRISKDYEVQ